MPIVNINIDNVNQRIIINRTDKNMIIREVSVCNTGASLGTISIYTQVKDGGEIFYIIKDTSLGVSNTFVGSLITLPPGQDFGICGLDSSYTIKADYE